LHQKLDYEEIVIKLNFIFLSVLFKNKKILKTEILLKGIEKFDKKRIHIVNEIKDYFFGKRYSFNLDLINFESLTPFKKDLFYFLSLIPRGKVTTYKNLSSIIKREKSQRAIGFALSKNPFPIIIPCHRVIKSDLTIGGYSYGEEIKRKILIFEGVEFENKNRVKKEFVL